MTRIAASHAKQGIHTIYSIIVVVRLVITTFKGLHQIFIMSGFYSFYVFYLNTIKQLFQITKPRSGVGKFLDQEPLRNLNF